MCFLSTAVLVVFVPFIYIVGNTFYAPVLIVFSILNGLYFLFTRRRHFHFALSWMLVVTLASIFWGSIETPGSGVEYFAVPLSLMPFTVIDRRSFCVTFVGVCAATILTSHFVQEWYHPHCIVPPMFVEATFTMVIVSVFITAALIISQFRIINSKYENIIREQKLIVESKNKDIIDSINYAQRIQFAKLPKMEEITRTLKECFVLFEPKDIVSGDFYYFSNSAQGIFLAAGDCTGHGVPGALMTMISSEKLEDAIAHTNDVSEILQYVNKGIKASLRQSENEESTRDGMDIALCSIDPVTRIVKYAGANRPLWIIRSGGSEVEEIKATKKSIGGHTPDNEIFASHEVQLHTGDTFYLTTDGYADLFGGKDNKKLTSRKFKEVLLGIQQLSMRDQHQYLLQFMMDWKGDAEQMDDVLVIGMRL